MQGGAQKIDGRNLRTLTTRHNLLEATRDLILAGVADPTAREIAAQAGTTTRTLFRHFDDMAALHHAFVTQQETAAASVMDEPFPEAPADRWQAQLGVVIDRRVRVYESLLPLYLSPLWRRYRAADTERPIGLGRRRRRLRQVLPDTVTQTLFEALDGVLGIEYWVGLRRDQRLSVAKSREVLTLVVARLTDGL